MQRKRYSEDFKHQVVNKITIQDRVEKVIGSSGI